ncbi:MAG TPA: hypothetical protein VIS94_13825 [Desulfomonilia bacterium]
MKRFFLLMVPLVFISAACVPADLPDKVYFKGNAESMNSRYYAAVRNGNIWVRPNVERTGVKGKWQMLDNLPAGLAGQVTEIAMDDEHIVALNKERQIYTMWNALDEVSKFRWQKAWGMPFWNGPGMKLRRDLVKWDFSVVSIPEDGYWTDPAGNLKKVGAAKCSHIIMLNEGGQGITFNDPWLPRDYSYGVGTPFKGRFVSVNLSSSGSTHFIINRYGDMFTRMFDFDISGLDQFFVYSYEDRRGIPGNPDSIFQVVQLPAEDWLKQPKIITTGRASITDRISIQKIGKNCIHRTLRVEGTDENGNTGFYEKDIREAGSASWRFHKTGGKLKGNILENKPYDSSAETLGSGDDLAYSMKAEGFTAIIPDFNCYNPPATLNIKLSEGGSISLPLHYRETIRLSRRAAGIDYEPRLFLGAIEAPQAFIDSLKNAPEEVKAFAGKYLETDGSRFTEIRITATLDSLEIKGSGIDWSFTGNESVN